MDDLNSLPLPKLLAHLLRETVLAMTLATAAEEDVGEIGDITTGSLAHANQQAVGRIVARQAGVIAGLAIVPLVIEVFEVEAPVRRKVRDGQTVEAGTVLAELRGRLGDILLVERTVLNVLGRGSGVATLTRRYVDAIRGTNAVICDTRKTMPGLRALDKYAARCGGATLHRLGLYDAALFKDNHLAGMDPARLTDELNHAARRVRAQHDLRFVEVEVDSLDQLQRVLACEKGLIDIGLLDNMPLEALREAVTMRNAAASQVRLEASGGVTLESVRAIADTGVDRISVGAITHSAPSLDVALEVMSE